VNAKDLYAALNAQLEEEKLFSDKGKDSALPESKRKERKEQEDARFLLDQLMMSGALPDPSLGPLSLDLVSKGKKLEESEGRVGLNVNNVMPFVDVSRQGDVSEYGVKYGGGDPSRAYELMLSQRVPIKTPGGEVEMPVVGQGSYSMPFAGGRLSAQGYVVPRQGEMPRSEYGANLMFMKRFAEGGEVEPSVDTEDRLQEKINLYRHGLISLEELTKHMRGMDPYDVARLFGGTDDNPLYKPKPGDISTLPFTPLDLPKDDDEDLEDPFLDLDRLAKRESRASEEIGAFPKVPFVNRLEVPSYPNPNLSKNPERRLAKGGEVSTTDFIRKREKGSPPEGEVPTDDYIQQMFTGTPPADKSTFNIGNLLTQYGISPADAAAFLGRTGAGVSLAMQPSEAKGMTMDEYLAMKQASLDFEGAAPSETNAARAMLQAIKSRNPAQGAQAAQEMMRVYSGYGDEIKGRFDVSKTSPKSDMGRALYGSDSPAVASESAIGRQAARGILPEAAAVYPLDVPKKSILFLEQEYPSALALKLKKFANKTPIPEGPTVTGNDLYESIRKLPKEKQGEAVRLLGFKGAQFLPGGKALSTGNFAIFDTDGTVSAITGKQFKEGGEVTDDDYIQQMFTGTPPAERAPQRGLLPPELREAVDVPLDFLNTFVRGAAGSIAGPVYGLYQGITSDKFGTPEGVAEAGAEAGKMMSKITGVPKTKAARDTLEFLGSVAEEAKIPPMPQFLTTPAPGPGSARALMRSYETAETPPVGAINVPGAKANRIFEDIPTTKTTATQYGAEFVQSPFVGRLDKMIAELPGPVQKEQFLNQLKGKFRDYEIGRAKEALKDLPDNAKITPFDLLNKIKEDFDPSRYGTSIVKPDPNDPDKFYASMDNIYKAPLGVIHLRQLATPEAEAGLSRAKDMYQALKNTTHAGINADLLNTPDAFNNYKANVNEFLRDLNQPERSVEANRLLDTAQASVNLYGRLSDAVDTINYPTLSSVYKTLQAEQKDLSKRFDYNAAIRTATQSAINDLDDIFPGTKVKLYDDIQALSGSDLALRTKAASNIRDAFSPTQNTVKEVFRQSMSGLRELLEKTYNNPKSPMAQFGYQGQHSGLGRTPTQTGIPNEIAFSRYSEHTTDVPDLGKVDGIYVHELQSDRLDDIRKKGPLGGSPTKDLPKAAELGKKLQNLTEQAAIENQRYLDNPTIEQKEKLTELQEQQKRTQEQLNKWMKRISEGQYKIKESFVGMEESPQVIQQLMAKNVIAAAIQMGKNFVAFPGAESSQAQLYEKLPNNLKQVVKDLGPGFEYRPITLTTPDGQDVMHPGVVWDKYGAGRIGAEGVPFKKGGEVRTEDFIKKVLK
jgi:hypothetical protein